jgi:hypothetical protein
MIVTSADLSQVEKGTRDVLGTAIEESRTYQVGRPNADGTITIKVASPEVEDMVYIRAPGEPGDGRGDAIPALSDIPPDQLVADMLVEARTCDNRLRITRTVASNTNSSVNATSAQGLLQPTSPASMKCIVQGAARWTGQALLLNASLHTKDFSSDIPHQQAVAVFVQLNPVTNTLLYVTSMRFDAARTLKQVFMTTLPRTVPDDHFPIGYIKLRSGQTAIARVDILNVNGTLAQGGASASDRNVDAFDEAVLLYAGCYIYTQNGALVVAT